MCKKIPELFCKGKQVTISSYPALRNHFNFNYPSLEIRHSLRAIWNHLLYGQLLFTLWNMYIPFHRSSSDCILLYNLKCYKLQRACVHAKASCILALSCMPFSPYGLTLSSPLPVPSYGHIRNSTWIYDGKPPVGLLATNSYDSHIPVSLAAVVHGGTLLKTALTRIAIISVLTLHLHSMK